MLSDRCTVSVPSCLSVTLVYCGQTVGWIKMKLGMQISLGPGHNDLNRDPVPHGKGHSSPTLSKFAGAGFTCVRIIRGPCLLWPNGWMGKDATWYGGRPWPRLHCVEWGPSSPKRDTAAPIFAPCIVGLEQERTKSKFCQDWVFACSVLFI